MTGYPHPYRRSQRILLLLALLVLSTGCHREVFTVDPVCPSADTKTHVHISVRILPPDGTLLKSATPFAPAQEVASDAESRIVTLRAIGFYADGNKEGTVAFNEIFVHKDEFTSDTIKPGVKGFTYDITEYPAVDILSSLDFETEAAGKVNVVLIANESLSAVLQGSGAGNTLCRVSDTDSGDLRPYDLSKVKKVDDLRQVFFSTNYFYLNSLSSPGLAGHEAYYRGAVPLEVWLESNGGLPMVGQEEIVLGSLSPAPDGVSKVVNVTIGLERLVAKVQVDLTNVDESSEQPKKYPGTNGHRVHSILLNNHPMYAMLLPTEREYVPPGAKHLLHSAPEGNRFMDMYRAEEKTLKISSGVEVLPIKPMDYEQGAQPEDNVYTHYSPAYLIRYGTYDQSAYLDSRLEWRPFTCPDVIIDGEGRIFDKNYKDQYDNSKGAQTRPLTLYMLPTTNEKMPVYSRPVQSGNGIAGMEHQPTELVVRIAKHKGSVKDFEWEYDPKKETVLAPIHLPLVNHDPTATGDKYAIRRNTFYHFKLTWTGERGHRNDGNVYVDPNDGTIHIDEI